ncbi:MAG: hypothetical protein HYT79_11335 [Elusimicrobia bacterium]|nr:hypothetical protein [Elusimicrobiota bacterium]
MRLFQVFLQKLNLARGILPALAGALVLLGFSFPLSTQAGEYLIYDSIAVTGSPYPYARGLAGDHLGNAYFLTYNQEVTHWIIKKLTPANEIITVGGHLGGYARLSVDPNLWIWALDDNSGAREIKKIDSSGNVVLSFGNSSALSLAGGIASDGTKVWVSHDAPWVCSGPGNCGWGGHGKLEAYSAANGSLLSSVSMPWRNGTHMVYLNGKLFVAGRTDLYCGTQRVWILNASDGSVSSSFIPGGNYQNCFTPDFVFSDSDGYFYLGSSYYSEGTGVKKFDSSGNAVTHFAVPGGYPGPYIGMAAIDGRRYVYALDADGNGNTAGDKIIRMAYNNTPNAATSLAPAGSASLHSREVALSWNPSYDADNDPIAYELYLSQTNGSPTSLSLTSTTSNTSVTLTPSPGNYYWMIRAKDAYRQADSITQQTNYTFVNSAPTVPSYSNKVFTTRDTSVLINWNPSTDADGDPITYRFYLGDTPGSLAEVASGSGNSYSFSGFNWGQAYYWKVRAEDAYGGVSEGPVASVTVNFQNSAPTAPILNGPFSRGIHSTGTFSDAISWLVSNDPDGDPVTYQVYQGSHPSSFTLAAGSVSGNFFTANGLAQWSTNYFMVSAVDSYGARTDGTPAAISYHLSNQPPQPIVYTSTWGTIVTRSTEVWLSWQIPDDPDGDPVFMQIWAGTNPAALSILGEGSMADYPLSGLSLNTTYYWRVSAVDAFGAARQGDVKSFWLQFKNSSPLVPSASSGNGVLWRHKNEPFGETVSWADAPDADGDPVTYSVYFGTGSLAKIFEGSGINSYFFEGLHYATTYYWQIIAKDPYSVTVGPVNQFQILLQNNPPSAPIASHGIGATTTRSTSHLLRWTGSLDPDGDAITYAVFAGTRPEALTVAAQNLVSEEFTFEDLMFGVTYYWRIRANDSFGASVLSSSASLTHLFLNTAPSSPVFAGDTLRARHGHEPFSDVLTWQSSLDAEGDAVNYALWTGTAPHLLVSIGFSTGTSMALTDLRFGTSYYAAVMASDVFGAVSQSDMFVWRCELTNNLPSAPVIHSPAGFISTRSLAYELTWAASQDSDADAFSYRVFWSKSGQSMPAREAGQATTMTFDSLEFHSTYYFAVEASDSFGGSSSGPAISVFLSYLNNNPQPESGHEAALPDGIVVSDKNSISISWPQYIDPDGDAVIYALYLGRQNDGASAAPPLVGGVPLQLVYQGALNLAALDDLFFHTNYVYQVEIRDSQGAVINGPAGSFSLVPRSAQSQAYNAPNPFRVNDGTDFVLTALEPVDKARIAVYSVYQDLIWEGHFGPLSAGVHRLRWDGRDASGKPVFSGMYLAVVETPGSKTVVRTVAIR